MFFWRVSFSSIFLYLFYGNSTCSATMCTIFQRPWISRPWSWWSFIGRNLDTQIVCCRFSPSCSSSQRKSWVSLRCTVVSHHRQSFTRRLSRSIRGRTDPQKDLSYQRTNPGYSSTFYLTWRPDSSRKMRGKIMMTLKRQYFGRCLRSVDCLSVAPVWMGGSELFCHHVYLSSPYG